MNAVTAWALPTSGLIDDQDIRVAPVRCQWPPQRIEVWEQAALRHQLREISELDEDWDGSGAVAVSFTAIQHAEAVLNELLPRGVIPGFVMPTTAGTVAFEWESVLGTAHLEIGNSTFGFYTAPVTGDSLMHGGSIEVMDAEQIAQSLRTILGSGVAHSVASGILGPSL